jgi:aryl-alcohol dehydrogenase-like predicted oxidoreductase
MEYTNVKGTDMQASRIGLGTWPIRGWEQDGWDEQEAVRTVHAALERGITVIDTAPVYGKGWSEAFVGKAVAQIGARERVLIATKAALEWRGDGLVRNGSRARITEDLEASLQRLQTDYIDIYQVHWPDPLVPLEETAAAMYELYQKGLIRAIGVSNFAPEQMEAFHQVAPLHTSQPPYNLFERDIEQDVLPYCQENNITMLTYCALCRGLLTGKMTSAMPFVKDDWRQTDPKFQAPRYAQYLKAVERLDRFAQENYGKRVLHLAVRWILDQGVEIPLWGAHHPEQLQPVDELWDWFIDAQAKAAIDEIIEETIQDPVGPEFMAPSTRESE